MKTYLECVKQAASIRGLKGAIKQLYFKLPQELIETLKEAADMYATQSNSHKHGVIGKQAISELITFCEEQKRKQYAISEAAGYIGNAHHIGAAQAYHKVIVKLNELAGVCSGLDKNA